MPSIADISAALGPFTRHRALLLRTTRIELKKLYAGSAFGMLWIVLGPAILMALYSIIYVFVFQVRPAALTVPQYVLHVVSGLLPFIAFSSALVTSATSIRSNREVLLSTAFPAELLPVRAVFVSSMPLFVGLALSIVAGGMLEGVSVWLLLLPLAVASQLLFSVGIAWMLALVTVIMKDVQHVLQYVVISLLIVTPIAYTEGMVPSQMQAILYLNPLYYFVRMYQHAIVYQSPPPNHVFIGAPLLGIVFYMLGFFLFQRTKQVVYDYV